MLSPALIDLYEALFSTAMQYPEAHEDQPWGHPALKVRKKVFVFLSTLDNDYISFSMKLPQSASSALELECSSPTGYGLGKHGWVSFKITKPGEVTVEQVLDWLDESYRAVAPKKLIKELDASAS